MTYASESYPLFGKTVKLVIFDAEAAFTEEVMMRAYELGLHLQKIFNIYDPQSEISTLNKKRVLHNASPELLFVLHEALRFCALTNGEYDITKGREFLQRKQGLTITPVACTYKDMYINNNTITLTHDEAYLDLGSVAKGYIAECMAQHLKKEGVERGYVDARGDIYCFGDPIDVQVQHPRDKNKILCTVQAHDEGVATSGDYQQYTGSYDQSHIVGKKDLISATVIAKSLLLAELYASVLMVCKKEEREQLLSNTTIPMSVIIMDNTLKTTQYNTSKNTSKRTQTTNNK